MQSNNKPAEVRAPLAMFPYHYSLIHHSLGVPSTGMQPPLFHLDIDNQQSGPHTGGGLGSDGGLLGKRLNQSVRGDGRSGYEGNDSLVTEQLLLRLTECETLGDIRVISLRNQQLTGCIKTLARCENLTIAYLQGNFLQEKDLMYLQTLTNLKKIDLSDNSITNLPPAKVFAGLTQLKFLYLHNNNISNWADIQSLVALPQIMHLTLFSNPVCSIPGYRHFLVNSMQSLLALDNFVITDEERIEDASFGYRFRGLNEFMKLHIPDYTKEKSAEQHLFNLEVDIYRLRRIFERNSPSVLIQSLYRGYRSRNFVKIYFNERRLKIIKIQKIARGYLLRQKLKRDLKDMLAYKNEEHLMMSNVELRKRAAARRIFENMVDYYIKKETMRKRIAAALKIQTYHRMRFIKNTSFIEALKLSKYPRLYILKEQKPIFLKVVKNLMPLFEEKHGMSFEDLRDCLQEDNKYDTIRVTEPDMFPRRNLPLIQFSKPIHGNFKVQLNKSLPPDKFADKNFTLRDFIFSPPDRKEWADRKLRILTNRSHTNHEQLKADLDQKKKNPFLSQFVFQDQYKDFLVFEPKHLDIVITICFYVLDYNRQVNIHEDQQMILFFERLLMRVAATATIRNAYKAHKWRQSRPQLPIDEIINTRAAICIQQQWSSWKLKKRMKALSNIKAHVDSIDTSCLFLEQGIYKNLNEIATRVHSQYRFLEQSIMFDFNPHTYQIHMQVRENFLEEDGHDIGRYKTIAVPRWFNLPLKTPDFMQTDYMNNLLALFHFNVGDCRVVPASQVINYVRQQNDVDRRRYYIEINCSSIDEAKKRALVLAYLTYDVREHNFVRLNTAYMMENPHLMHCMYKIFDKFHLDLEENGEQEQNNSQANIDLKAVIAVQTRQQHGGFICSEKDKNELRYHDQYKTMLFNDRLIHVTVRDEIEERLMERELVQMASRIDVDVAAQGPQAGLSFWETRKINEQNLQEMKIRMQEHIRKKAQEFRHIKNEVKIEVAQEDYEVLEEKQQEVMKQREIKKIIKNEQKAELDRNIQVFLHLNKEERALRRELCDKQVELQFKEKYLRRVGVKHVEKVHKMKKEERDKFIGSFAQAKNLIEKQMKMGNLIRDQKAVLNKNRKRVSSIKQDKVQENHVVAIKNKLYDNSALETSTQRSSFIGPPAPLPYASNSQIRLDQQMGEFSHLSGLQDLGSQGFSLKKVYRTDSASKPFGLKRPPMPQRNGTVYTSANKFNRPTDGRYHAETFSQNFKSYKGVAPQALHRENSFTAGYATAADRYSADLGGMSGMGGNIPAYLNEMDFTGQSKDRLINQLNKSNRPQMKRVLNNQVFLEESDPLLPDDFRKNQYAIDAGSNMLGSQNASPLTVLPALGPQPGPPNVVAQSSLFSLPKSQFGYHKRNVSNQYQPVANVGALQGNISSYMTQGEYSHHPIFHT